MSKHRLNPRYFLFAVMVALLGSACQDARATPEGDDVYGDLETVSPDGKLVVYWHTLTGAEEAHLLAMIDDFNSSNEWDITVVGEYQGDLRAISEKILAGRPTDQLPSLVMTDRSLVADYAAQDIAVALSPYIESESWGFSRTALQDFYPSLLSSERLPQFEDQIFGFPGCRSLQVLYYNAGWLKELGHDTPPQTWDGFRTLACAASEPIDGIFGFEFGMNSGIFTSLLATQNVSLLNQGATAYTLGNERGRGALEYLQDLISEGCAAWETEQGVPADFGAAKILFAIDSTAQMSLYRHAVAKGANFAWSLSLLPRATEEPLIGVHGAGMTILRSNPEEQLAAWLFVKWLAEPAQQARWSQDTGCFPIRKSALEDMATYLEEHPQYGVASQFLDQGWTAEPGVTAYAACRGEIDRMLYAVTAGEDLNHWFNDTLNLCNQALADTKE